MSKYEYLSQLQKIAKFMFMAGADFLKPVIEGYERQKNNLPIGVAEEPVSMQMNEQLNSRIEFLLIE